MRLERSIGTYVKRLSWWSQNTLVWIIHLSGGFSWCFLRPTTWFYQTSIIYKYLNQRVETVHNKLIIDCLSVTRLCLMNPALYLESLNFHSWCIYIAFITINTKNIYIFFAGYTCRSPAGQFLLYGMRRSPHANSNKSRGMQLFKKQNTKLTKGALKSGPKRLD